MKSAYVLLAVFLVASMSSAQSDTLPDSKNAALLKQACQMGKKDKDNGSVMNASGITVKNATGEYVDLEAVVRKEYERCYQQQSSAVENSPTSYSEKSSNDSQSEKTTTKKQPVRIVDNKKHLTNSESSELKLPPRTSEMAFAWFHAWVAVVEEAPERYVTVKKHAAKLRNDFIKQCQKVYLVGQSDDALIKRWCKVDGWKEFNLSRSALRDDTFDIQLEQMKQQIALSEESYRKFADRDVKNAFDRTRGISLDYKMENIEETKVMPYVSGISVALSNINATKSAMKSLQPQVVEKRKNDYRAELKMIEEKRIEEEKKRLQRINHERQLKQKSQADSLSEFACNKGKEDATKLKRLQPDQFKSKATLLDMIDGIDKLVAARYTECYDTQLLSLTCKKAGSDYMQCRDDGPPQEYVSLASKSKSIDAFQAEYKKCYKERKVLYGKEKLERNKAKKDILKYSDIYREHGGYFINDYNDCVSSLVSAIKSITNKLQFVGLSSSDVRSCENDTSLIESYATQNCSCSYGVVIDALDENKFTEFSEDILSLIKFGHSNIIKNGNTRYDGKGINGSLVHPDEAVELYKKMGAVCAK